MDVHQKDEERHDEGMGELEEEEMMHVLWRGERHDEGRAGRERGEGRDAACQVEAGTG